MNNKTPWLWVPTLYFAEGIPYFIVNVISVTMFKRLGMGNAALAAYTSMLYLPWVIKPLWGPLVDIVRSKRWWIVTMQAVMTVAFALLALSVPHISTLLAVTLILFYITAFASATHDIAADGYYMIALDPHRQSLFVGIRSTFYRIASVFGQGVIVVLAGVLETRLGDIPRAWELTLLLCSAMFALVTIYHHFVLPRTEELSADPASRDAVAGKDAESSAEKSTGASLRGFGEVFASFFRKPQVWIAIVFMLLYRLPEALSVKMLSPFMLDPVEAGGLGLSTVESGLVYGTVGVIALTLGGILGGLFAARYGLKRSLWPMALSLALPCAVYLYMSIAQPQDIWQVYLCVAFDQFGYGFGFTAYMLYMMYFSEGPSKTSHYALCTAFMALSMMVPGLFAGLLQEALGYTGFFILVMVCCLATVAVTFLIKVDPEYGKK
ncbi:MAG: MFS transporter [Bacteroidales bacterium]|nr:MFS transporter [Bacteroidales bacterium]